MARLNLFITLMVLRLFGWRTMDSAPRDGTHIVVIETPNSEAYNVMEAHWVTPYYGNSLDAPKSNPNWWGISSRRGFTEWGDGPWGRPTHIAITPMVWRPKAKMPVSADRMARAWDTLYEKGGEG